MALGIGRHRLVGGRFLGLGKPHRKLFCDGYVARHCDTLYWRFRGFVSLAQGITLRSSGVRDAGWVIFSSIVVIAISLAVLFVPDVIGVAAVVVFVAIALMAYGISRISLGFRLATVGDR